MRIRDISISREHALLITKGSELFLCDYGSKFGSLLLCDKEIHITQGSGPRILQIGRSLLKLSVEMSKWKALFGRCQCASLDSDDTTMNLDRRSRNTSR